MKRYVVFIEIGNDGKLSHPLGSDSVFHVDGRLSNANALRSCLEWGERYAKFRKVERYTLALVSVHGFKWQYLTHLNLPLMPHVTVANIKPVVEE